jgi:hypothetical protein
MPDVADLLPGAELGGNVKKGEEVEREIPILKSHTVFNAEQCEGLPLTITPRRGPLPSPSPNARIDAPMPSSWRPVPTSAPVAAAPITPSARTASGATLRDLPLLPSSPMS